MGRVAPLMHTYSTDNDLRPKVIGGIGVISFVSLGAIEYVLSLLTETSALRIMLGVASWGLIFFLLFMLFDKRGWKMMILRRLNIVKIPDLDGRWEGWIETSHNGDPPVPDEAHHPENEPDSEYTKMTASLTIEQTWHKISIYFETETSSSDSEGATILTGKGNWPNLTYQYENNPPPDTPEGMEMHYGTADLELKGGRYSGQILEGVYYTGPGRQNHGKMYFEKNDR